MTEEQELRRKSLEDFSFDDPSEPPNVRNRNLAVRELLAENSELRANLERITGGVLQSDESMGSPFIAERGKAWVSIFDDGHTKYSHDAFTIIEMRNLAACLIAAAEWKEKQS